LCVTSQNLIECWAVCTRPVENNGLGLAPALAVRVLSRIESAAVRLVEDDVAYAEWRKLVTSHAVSGKKTHDARLVASMKVHGVTHVLTFNGDDFRRFEGIQVIHPKELESEEPVPGNK
jgi:predicted nucleic acid-binding protein